MREVKFSAKQVVSPFGYQLFQLVQVLIQSPKSLFWQPAALIHFAVGVVDFAGIDQG